MNSAHCCVPVGTENKETTFPDWLVSVMPVSPRPKSASWSFAVLDNSTVTEVLPDSFFIGGVPPDPQAVIQPAATMAARIAQERVREERNDEEAADMDSSYSGRKPGKTNSQLPLAQPVSAKCTNIVRRNKHHHHSSKSVKRRSNFVQNCKSTSVVSN